MPVASTSSQLRAFRRLKAVILSREADHRTLSPTVSEPIVHRTSHGNRAALLAGVACLALIATGCGRVSPPKAVDVRSLERELQYTTRQRFLAEGYGYTTRVRCGPGNAPNVYNCDVLVTNPPRHHHIEWTEVVLCRTPSQAFGVQPCSSATGDALQ
jgi:hypothetical protein